MDLRYFFRSLEIENSTLVKVYRGSSGRFFSKINFTTGSGEGTALAAAVIGSTSIILEGSALTKKI